MRKIILILTVLSLICIGCSKKAPEERQSIDQTVQTEESKESEVVADKDPTPKENADSAPEAQVNAYAVNEVKIDINNEAGVFSGEYPAFGIAEIDQDIKNEVEARMNSVMERFLRSVRELDDDAPVDLSKIGPAPERPHNDGEDDDFDFGSNGFRVSYEVIQNTKDSIDVCLDFSQYFQGAAHPVSGIVTLMYDVKTGKRVELKSLFKDWDKALKVMSEESRKRLKEELGDLAIDDMIDSGTTPEEIHFRNILRTPMGIRIYFEQYEVAPYAAGEQTVDLPLSLFE